jgi:hypothetical protein
LATLRLVEGPRDSAGALLIFFEGILRNNETEEETCAHVSMRLKTWAAAKD